MIGTKKKSPIWGGVASDPTLAGQSVAVKQKAHPHNVCTTTLDTCMKGSLVHKVHKIL